MKPLVGKNLYFYTWEADGLQNIRQIFHERYGQNVNFSGYIDKFYSKAIFEYNIKEEVRNHIRYIIKPFLEANERDRHMIHLLQGFCEPILEKFVMEGAVQIREIEKLYHSPREEFDIYYLVLPGYRIHNKSFDYFPLVGFFLHVFSNDLKKLTRALDLCSYKKPAIRLDIESRNAVKGYLFGMFLPFVTHIDFSQLQKKVSLYEDEGEKFYFKVVSADDVWYRDKYRTAFVEKESSKEIAYSGIEVNDQSIFKAWRKALKATHGI
ncbi:hypothetical protein [Marinilabilia salmonicolor]|uniref:Uncharacterized protein n=1 Tax=Marinilabilia salmonicolor TaxID=989 RepID=A0A368UX08_9BACT|nr:hypothetical protein [Marinilabilia salmonicolor]RCW31934.1 hypothetical protein DFO77_1161 [Marinilabilia salmonicolor]